MTQPSIEELIGVLIAHRHSYDSDCAEDYGCSCGWGEKTNRWAEHGEYWQNRAFAEHLADVLWDTKGEQ